MKCLVALELSGHLHYSVKEKTRHNIFPTCPVYIRTCKHYHFVCLFLEMNLNA